MAFPLRRLPLLVATLLLTAPQLAIAAPPTVPTSLPYQGLLLDGLGQPRTGSVDLTLRIWDAVVGGTLVYKQSFPAVSLEDGVFSVQLGPTGEASDAPSNPLTTDLATALAGDAGPTAPVRFLEMTVGAEGPLSRTQILASAYAVRAASAATADSAASATAVGGFSAEYVTQFFTHSLADGGNPPNTDPREGLADVDGDGRANFVDTDNDGDGLVDELELLQSSDINLVTPTLASISPDSGFTNSPTAVTVTGTNFDPGLTFTVGAESASVSNVTATSFQATIAPQAAGTVDVAVALPNGQSDSIAGGFDFITPPPASLPGVAHGVSLGVAPNLAVAYDLAVRPGTTEIALAGRKQYGVGDATSPLTVHPLDSRGSPGEIAIAFDGANRVSGLRCRDVGGCVVEVLVDADGDGQLVDETGAAIETLGGSATLESAQLERNPSTGGMVAAYIGRAFGAQAVVAHDLNADGDFADAGEKLVLEPAGASGPSKSALAVDSAGRVAYAYWVGAVGVRLAWDRNGDGDFADTVSGNPELSTLVAGGFNCFDLAFDGSDVLIATVNDGSGQKLLRDVEGDGDFTGAGEELLLTTSTSNCTEVAAAASQPLAVAWANLLRVDRSGDGDFDDAGESELLTGGSLGTSGDLKENGTDRVIAIAGPNAYVGDTSP
ncbi:MAG: hypothetical protein DCC71_18375 [Proteobacteria bacterium]|nr:MAG: hypothetical protein DCC71_18375 [Pseudomonadota bacterium]